MSTGPRTKHCWVAYAARERQYVWSLEVPENASVEDVLSAVRGIAADAAVPWESAGIGIFGEPCSRTDVPRDGDRIEIYRPLVEDPKQARRDRVRRRRR